MRMMVVTATSEYFCSGNGGIDWVFGRGTSAFKARWINYVMKGDEGIRSRGPGQERLRKQPSAEQTRQQRWPQGPVSVENRMKIYAGTSGDEGLRLWALDHFCDRPWNTASLPRIWDPQVLGPVLRHVLRQFSQRSPFVAPGITPRVKLISWLAPHSSSSE